MRIRHGVDSDATRRELSGKRLRERVDRGTYNDVIPKLIQQDLPTGVLGIAVTVLLASFMAGMAANVSSFNTAGCGEGRKVG
ncbi:MAG TPA: hypothetical protein VK537_03920 [Galbitalea sp.]|nr:hypothetical protein [Galbitalea sp.]